MRISKLSKLILGISFIALVVPVAAFAVEYGGGSVQGYSATTPIEYGAIVRLAGGDAKKVEIASEAELKNMMGVAVDPRQLSMIISEGGLTNETFVAVSGTYNTLVSTQAGNIEPGDYLTLSSIKGVAMKAGTDEPQVFGRATIGFSESSAGVGSAVLKDVNGKTGQTVKLGSIPVTIDIRQNPNKKSTKANLPEMLERAGQAIAEKEVSPVRIYLSLAIAVVCLLASIIVIYSGVRSGVISIGRNPMSKKSIFRALLQIIITSILILVIGVFAVYLLLKL